MSVETITQSDVFAVPHVTFRVAGYGRSDAEDSAKREARESGWRTKTLVRTRLDERVGGVREWLVTLAAWPPKEPDVLFAGMVGEFLDVVEGGS